MVLGLSGLHMVHVQKYVVLGLKHQPEVVQIHLQNMEGLNVLD